MWNGDYYSVDDLKNQLDKLPEGVTTHILTNICYGGKLLELTGPDTCVMANSDAYRVSYSFYNRSPFISSFADALKNNRRDGNANGRNSMLEAFSYARDNDHPMNEVHLTSLDYFLDQQTLHILREMEKDPDLVQCHPSTTALPASKLIGEIDLAVQAIRSRGDERRRQSFQGELEEKISELKERFNSPAMRLAESEARKLVAELDARREAYMALPELEQNRLRPSETRRVERLRDKIVRRQRFAYNIERDYEMAIKELRFLKYASKQQFEEYLSIKRCLDYEL